MKRNASEKAQHCIAREETVWRDPVGFPLPPYAYKEKHRWSIKLNFLSGITLVPWLALLTRHWRSIDWLVYPHRILFLTFMAVLNTALALFDWLLFSRAVAAQPLNPEPIFILGHPRTGTTHLHNLLSTDPRFAFATTFHAGFPSSFLFLEPARWLLSGLLERRRPMDHMALDWDLPAEDEIAVNVLTGGDSPYLALVLPRLWRPLLRSYLTFGAGAADGVQAGVAAGAAAKATGPPAEGVQAAAAASLRPAAAAAPPKTMRTRHGPARERRAPRSLADDLKEAAAAAVGAPGSVADAGGLGKRGRSVVGGCNEHEVSEGGRTPCAAVAGEADPRVSTAFKRWLAAFTWFLRKVTYRHVRTGRRHAACTNLAPASAGASPPPLLIKSPVHTARLAIWRRLFPRARYIFVHRHPLEVFQSAANMADTYYWYTYLQRPTDAVTNDFITDQYDLVYESYLAERRHIPQAHLVEVAFADLESDPMGTLRRIYQHFGWDEHFAAVSGPRFQRYLEGLEDFRKNHFNRLGGEAEAVLRERWRQSFEVFGYT